MLRKKMKACFHFGDHLVEYRGSLIKQFPMELFAVALPLTRGARSVRLRSMNDSTGQKFEEVEAAVKQAVANFASEIENIFGKFDPVAPSTIVEFTLLELCEELSKRADLLRGMVGPATVKLLDAMAEYPDSPVGDR
jgi:hypothetical protein